jgi:hypothetical protein
MRIILSAKSSNSDFSGRGYVIVHVDGDYIEVLLSRLAAAAGAGSTSDPPLLVSWQDASPYFHFACDKDFCEDLDGLIERVEHSGWAFLPPDSELSSELSSNLEANSTRTDSDVVEVTTGGELSWASYIKHTDISVTTTRITGAVLEQWMLEWRGRSAEAEVAWLQSEGERS